MSDKFGIVSSGKVHQLQVMNTSKDDAGEYAFTCGRDRVSAALTVNRKSPHESNRAAAHLTTTGWIKGLPLALGSILGSILVSILVSIPVSS